MKKINLLIAMFLCAIGASMAYGVNLNGSAASTQLGDGGIDDGSKTINIEFDKNGNVKSVVETTKESKKNDSSNASLPNGKAYVGVDTELSMRDGAWGNIIGSLKNNDEVEIIGTDGDWYKVNANGQTGYVHSRYIFKGKDMAYSGNDVVAPTSGVKAGPVNMTVTGDSIQGKVINAAQQLVDNYSVSSSFPYAPETKGGSLGCAQVVSTALVAAGVVPNVDLCCDGVMSMLSSAGWSKVQAPPFQAGDVIFWATYDMDGDGVIDPNTHIGIIITSGNSSQAMSNSSSEKKPRYHDAQYAPVTTVMRKC